MPRDPVEAALIMSGAYFASFSGALKRVIVLIILAIPAHKLPVGLIRIVAH
jgi:hypothetical protein